MENEKEFAQVIYVNKPKQDFIAADFGIKIADFGPWFMEKAKAAKADGDEFINIQFKEGKSGNMYAEVNNWKPSNDGGNEVFSAGGNDEDIPF